ncbi:MULTISPECIES: hypothetical protein [Stenotrophomonas]|uniref:hypothetical protein n=1 Tax=Stenotrophomonas TaxID=40323 RepID=UPI0008DE1D25|nr:hypothetical protein [Stenotrophomonas maltophilia]OHY62236.1 hypothetical protein BB780_20470 [Stenotrophomonas maltophilia]HEL4846212.1 hypothetical protein [Stenotrophomonas maltophilia]
MTGPLPAVHARPLSTTTTTEDVLERLSAFDAQLKAHYGYLKALEYGLCAVIVTHPKPQDLAQIWKQLPPQISTLHGQSGSSLFDAALNQALGLLAEQMEEFRT